MVPKDGFEIFLPISFPFDHRCWTPCASLGCEDRWTSAWLSGRRKKTGSPRPEAGAESLPSSGALSHREDADESALPGNRTWEATGVVE